MKRNNNIGYNIFILLILAVFVLFVTGFSDVIKFYQNSSTYTEYEGKIIECYEHRVASRETFYYCTVSYMDENKDVVEKDGIIRLDRDKVGDVIQIYIGDDGSIYRKGYIHYMNNYRMFLVYGICVVGTLLKVIKHKNYKNN